MLNANFNFGMNISFDKFNFNIANSFSLAYLEQNPEVSLMVFNFLAQCIDALWHCIAQLFS